MSTNIAKHLDYYFIATKPDQVYSTDSNQDWAQKLCQFRHPQILCCITIYNEPDVAILYSLAGLKNNIDYLVKIGKQDLAEQITICLIFDGRDKLSASALKLIETLEIYNSKQLFPEAAMHIFDSELNLELVEKLVDIETISNQSNNCWFDVYQTAQQVNKDNILRNNSSVSPRVLVCIKEKNAGKLDSHYWFFKIFSTYLQPNYCIQMDVGGVPQANNIYDMSEFLEQNSDVGAAAGSLLVPEPARPWNFIFVWQFGNFCLDKLLFSPAELVAGYLSVLPGQFNMVRWQALAPQNQEEVIQIQSLDPLERYFRGLGQLGVFETNMFLAEDRILGFEIVTRAFQNWKIAYLPSVVTLTDSCQSLSELLRQRRRWINGSFACRIWIFTQLPPYLGNKNVSMGAKLRILRSVPLYILRAITDWFYPSVSVAVFALIYKSTWYILFNSSLPTWPSNLLFSVGIILIAVQIFLCQINKLNATILDINVVYGSLYLLIVITLAIYAGYWLPIIIIGFFIFIVYSIASIHSPWLATKIFKYIPLYFLINFPIKLGLKASAFFNINDCSWGTKGLTKAELNSQNKSNKLYKKRYVSLWLLSNLLLLIITFNSHSYLAILVLALLDLSIGVIAGILIALKILYKKYIYANQFTKAY